MGCMTTSSLIERLLQSKKPESQLLFDKMLHNHVFILHYSQLQSKNLLVIELSDLKSVLCENISGVSASTRSLPI
jgi:hypothetical protein